MDRKFLVTVAMSSLLAATAVLAIQALAAEDTAPREVVCEEVRIKKTSEALQAAVSAGRSEIRIITVTIGGVVSSGSTMLICAW